MPRFQAINQKRWRKREMYNNTTYFCYCGKILNEIDRRKQVKKRKNCVR